MIKYSRCCGHPVNLENHGPSCSSSRCKEHGKVLPHFNCKESEEWLDSLEDEYRRDQVA